MTQLVRRFRSTTARKRQRHGSSQRARMRRSTPAVGLTEQLSLLSRGGGSNMGEHPDTPSDTPDSDTIVDAVASSPSQEKVTGRGWLKQVGIGTAAIGAIGVIAAAFVPVLFKPGHSPRTFTPSTANPSLMAC